MGAPHSTHSPHYRTSDSFEAWSTLGTNDAGTGTLLVPNLPMSSPLPPLPCNGSPALCNLPVTSVVFPGVHNAMSSQADGFQAPNNLLGLEDALDAGIRAVQLDSCDCGGSLGLQMCHGECFFLGFIALGYKSPLTTFANIKSFLDDNPREVIVIDLQVNDGTLDALYYDVLDTIPGFTDMMYQHPRRRDPWPTLGTLIESNERILFFQHNGNNCRIEGGCPPGVMGTFHHMFDTPWDLDEDGLMDYERSCTKNRGLLTAQFMLSNHFADEGLFPSLEISENVNQISVLRDRHEYCREKLGKEVNVIVVDFWSLGDVIQYAQEENDRRAGAVALGTNTTEAVVTPQRTTLSPTVRPSEAPSIISTSPSEIPSIVFTPSASPSKDTQGRAVSVASDPVISAASAQNTVTSGAEYKYGSARLGACLPMITFAACAYIFNVLL